eukprot:CAMPEP_0182592696 /NCGR_PEP_ID=MMETSP1324-20130603/76442_1 /TAXON_ID=236786 /ORGANISM="Florenciella sp., Strain RCC1587" /LENGTH=115 /DNA_ID=CAMNT_0024810109 /DNA_START=16 /DNA_END=360 /DNA_ORIENTATION=-
MNNGFFFRSRWWPCDVLRRGPGEPPAASSLPREVRLNIRLSLLLRFSSCSTSPPLLAERLGMTRVACAFASTERERELERSLCCVRLFLCVCARPMLTACLCRGDDIRARSVPFV